MHPQFVPTAQDRDSRTARHVLFISHDSNLHGAQTCLAELLRAIDRKRFRPFLISPAEGPLNDLVRRLGIPVAVRRLKPWAIPRLAANSHRAAILASVLSGLRDRVWAIAKQIEMHDIDVVYTNTVTILEGALAARLMKRPHVWYLHEVLRGNKEIRGMLPQWIVNRVVRSLSTELIVNSRFNARIYGLDTNHGKGVLAYPGIDTDKFSPMHKSVPNPLDVYRDDKDTKLVGVLGALQPRKGHGNLIEAAYILQRKLPNVRYLLTGVGYPEYLERLRKHVSARGLSDQVVFLGWLDDHRSLLANVDLLVSAAQQESFGLTVAEAMASGTPVVATASGGPQEIIVDGVHGRLVPVDNPGALANAMFSTLSNSDAMRSFAEAGFERVHSAFSLKSHVSAIERVLDRVANGATVDSRPSAPTRDHDACPNFPPNA